MKFKICKQAQAGSDEKVLIPVQIFTKYTIFTLSVKHPMMFGLNRIHVLFIIPFFFSQTPPNAYSNI